VRAGRIDAMNLRGNRPKPGDRRARFVDALFITNLWRSSHFPAVGAIIL
jgi:hypothetical protein